MNSKIKLAVAAVPLFSAYALAVDPVFVDNFANGIVEDSDSQPAFWGQRLSGSISAAAESGGAMRLTAGGSQYPHGQIASPVQSDFNFFRAPIVVEGSGLNFTSSTNSLNKGIFRMSMLSRTLFLEAPVPPAPGPAVDDSEYWADDVVALRIESGNNTPGQYQIALGVKENYPVHNSEYDGFQLFNPGNNPGANFSGPIRNFRLVYSPKFWNLTVTHDTSPTNTTPLVKTFTGGVDQFMVNWKDPADLGALTGDSAIALQTQLNNAGGTEQATAALEQFKVGQLRQGWQGPSGGDWSNPANWSDSDILHVNGDNSVSSVPNFVGANVRFGNAASPVVVTTDLDQTLGAMYFDSAASYTVQPGGLGQGTLQMDTRWFANEVNALQGSHTVISPINIYKDLRVSAEAGAKVTLTGQVTDLSGAGTLGLAKNGAGTIEMVNIRLFNVAVNAGTLRVSPGSPTNNSPVGASLIRNLTIAGTPSAPTAALDLSNNALVLDYSGASPIDNVRELLRSGINTGLGIVSSSTTTSRRLGYGEGSVVAPGGTFAGQPVDGDSVVIAYTLAGDSNLDFTVNISDFATLAANFNTSGLWRSGDFDYNGLVNINDFSLLASNFNQVLPRGAAVPEPALLSSLAAGALLLIRRRK